MASEYEYQPLRLPPGTDRVSARVQLTIQAEFAGWELATLKLFHDGSRKVMLRRRLSRHHADLPGLSV